METQDSLGQHGCCRCGEPAAVAMRVKKTGTHRWFCAKHYRQQCEAEEERPAVLEAVKRAEVSGTGTHDHQSPARATAARGGPSISA
jgi:hypothetical protein